MTPEQIDELINKLLSTGEFLATEAYKLAYRQILVDGVLQLLFGTLLLITLAALTVHIVRNSNNSKSIWYEGKEFAVIAVVAMLVPALFLVLPGINNLANPGWHAVELLFNTFLQ